MEALQEDCFRWSRHTHDDIWKNYLKYRLQLAKAVASLLATEADDRLGALETNDKYAAAMARVHYLRKPGALPRQGDVEGMAHYWKDNTTLKAAMERGNAM